MRHLFIKLAGALALAGSLSGCVSQEAVDRAVNDPSRIELAAPATITFAPGRTYGVFELASRSDRTGKRIFCDMRATRRYAPRRTFLAGECEGTRSFVIGDFDGSLIVDALRTQLPNGAILAIYEIDTPMEGEFAAVANSINANFPLRVLADRRPVHQFRPGAIHLLARSQAGEAALMDAFLQAFPNAGGRLSGQILRTFQPVCDSSQTAPICSFGAEGGANGPVIVQQSRDGTRTQLNTDTAGTAPAAPSAPAVPGSPPLFEGTPYSAFSPEQIAAYCAQDWSERTGAGGRTEYNPCKRREAFP